MPIRTRFAPSPTGYLHIGGLRTALYQMLFAKKNGGTFVLRIEDTDKTRQVEGAAEALCRTLQTVGIIPDEGAWIDEKGILIEKGDHGSYIQSKNMERHRAYAAKLVELKKAYPCFCTEERLQEMRKSQEAAHLPSRYDRTCRAIPAEEAKKRVDAGEKHVIRLALPTTGSVTFHDEIRGDVSFNWGEVDDQVIIKSDGMATYHLAAMCDDHDMEITHVIRGEEWISSTPKHLFIYESFGWTPPVFAHLPLLLNADRSKLSKRQGDVAVEDFLERGYFPEALVNFVALLGWNPSGDKEIYKTDELIEAFDLTKINKSGAIVNFEKLLWLNREYLKMKTENEYLSLVLPELQVWRQDVELQKRLALVIRERITIPKEASQYARDFFPSEPRPESLRAETFVFKSQSTVDAANSLEQVIKWLKDFKDTIWQSPINIENELKSKISETGLKNGDVLWPLRVALSGKTPSPPPFDFLYVLGKEASIERLKPTIQLLRDSAL